MARVVFSHRQGDAFLHQFRNFGEDVWSEFRDEEKFDVSLDEIDRAADRFEVRVKKALVRPVIMRTEPILKRHLLEDRVMVAVEE